jgi:acetyl-CoA carboxylase biotin carboxyl carrier protein
VSDKFDALTDEDVRQIGRLIEMLDKSGFDYLRLDTGNLKVIVGKGDVPPDVSGSVPAVVAAPVPAPAQPAAAATPVSKAQAAQPTYGENVVAVTAPMIGRFYAQPEPGAAPFVTLGSQVSATTTIALIEVMKIYTSVEAGVDGEICEICVQDGAFVEFGAVLFRIKKTISASTSKRKSAPAKT